MPRTIVALVACGAAVAVAGACLDLDVLQDGADGSTCADCADGTAAGDVTNEGGTLTDGPAETALPCPDGSVPTGTGGCLAVCNGVTCGDHEGCSDEAGAGCACIVGYGRDGGACVWSGGPLDPEFMNVPPGTWSIDPLDAGVAFLPDAAFTSGPGILNFQNKCVAARAFQSFPMPPAALAEPFALDLYAGLQFGTMRLAYGGKYLERPSTGGGTTPVAMRTCLGEGAYGGNVELSFERPKCDAFRLDRAAIVADPACPKPGGIVSADFQSAGWVATGGGEVTTSGLNGLSGHLPANDACDSPKLTGLISIPSSIAHPALSINYKGTTDATAELAFEGAPFGAVVGTNSLETANVCLPDWPRGLAGALSLSLGPRSGGCSGGTVTDFLFDDLTVVDDPSCESPGYVFDPSFERAQASHVRYFRTGNGVKLDTPFTKLDGAMLVHLKSQFPACGDPALSTTASVFVSLPPAPASGGGAPRATFAYRVTQNSGAPGITANGTALDPQATQGAVCFSASKAGRGATVDFSVSVTCYDSAQMDVDKIAVDWWPGCP